MSSEEEEEDDEEEEDEVDDEGEDRAALDFAAQVNLAGPTFFSESSVQAGPPWGAAAAGGCDPGVFSWLLPLLSPWAAVAQVAGVLIIVLGVVLGCWALG